MFKTIKCKVHNLVVAEHCRVTPQLLLCHIALFSCNYNQSVNLSRNVQQGKICGNVLRACCGILDITVHALLVYKLLIL